MVGGHPRAAGTSRTRSAAASSPSRTRIENLARALSAATGWDYTLDEAMRFGRRTARSSAPSTCAAASAPSSSTRPARYGSHAGRRPRQGHSRSTKHWERMLDVWYEGMGYDRETGRPTPETLRAVGLEWMVPAVWGGDRSRR